MTGKTDRENYDATLILESPPPAPTTSLLISTPIELLVSVDLFLIVMARQSQGP